MGADYLLIISPYYNKANNQGMIAHFTAVADAVNIPIIMYNIPGRTGVAISEDAVKVLSKHTKYLWHQGSQWKYFIRYQHCTLFK